MKVKVLIDTLNHNGRKRVPGELIEMEDGDVEPLIKIKAVEVVAEAPPPPPPQDPGHENDKKPAKPEAEKQRTEKQKTE